MRLISPPASSKFPVFTFPAFTMVGVEAKLRAADRVRVVPFDHCVHLLNFVNIRACFWWKLVFVYARLTHRKFAKMRPYLVSYQCRN